MIDVYVSDLRTGDDLIRLPAKGGAFEDRRNSAERARASITLRASAHRRLDLRSTLSNGKSLLSFFGPGDVCLGAVAIQEHDYDRDERTLEFAGEGIWSVLRRRFVLPLAADTQSLLLTSGDQAGEPNPATRTVITGQSWPRYVRTLIEQSMSRLGGQLPIVFGSDGIGSHGGSYEGSAFMTVGEALDNLVDRLDGPEIDFLPRRRADRQGIEFLARVGDDSQLELASKTVHEFDFSARRPTVRGLRVRSSASDLRSEAWATGGRQASVALVSRAFDQTLIDAGFPRYESVSSANSTVVEQQTLDSYTGREVRDGSRLTEWWSFESLMSGVPALGTWLKGDYADITLGDDDPYVPAGTYRRRIAAYSFDIARPKWVKLTMDEAAA